MEMMGLGTMKEFLEDVYRTLKRQEELGLSALDGNFTAIEERWFFETQAPQDASSRADGDVYSSPHEGLSQLRAVLEMPDKVASPALVTRPASDTRPTRVAPGSSNQSEPTKACPRCGEMVNRGDESFSRGLEGAALMFLGDGLGAQGAKRSNPFTGEVGELLKKMIRAMGLSRNQVFLTTMPQCEPLDSASSQIESTCHTRLEHEIRRVSPQVIVTLGQATSQAFLERDKSIVELRGKFVRRNGIEVMPTYHPAYLLKVKEAKKLVWADLQLVMAKLGLKRR